MCLQSQEERHQNYISGRWSVVVSVDFEQAFTHRVVFPDNFDAELVSLCGRLTYSNLTIKSLG